MSLGSLWEHMAEILPDTRGVFILREIRPFRGTGIVTAHLQGTAGPSHNFLSRYLVLDSKDLVLANEIRIGPIALFMFTLTDPPGFLHTIIL